MRAPGLAYALQRRQIFCYAHGNRIYKKFKYDIGSNFESLRGREGPRSYHAQLQCRTIKTLRGIGKEGK